MAAWPRYSSRPRNQNSMLIGRSLRPSAVGLVAAAAGIAAGVEGAGGPRRIAGGGRSSQLAGLRVELAGQLLEARLASLRNVVAQPRRGAGEPGGSGPEERPVLGGEGGSTASREGRIHGLGLHPHELA